MRRAAVTAAVLGLLLALAPAAQAATRWYVSVGGTLAAGPGPGRGFVPRLLDDFRRGEPTLALRNFACGGATTSSVLRRRGCAQVARATGFLRANRAASALVTVELGATDVLPCAHGRSVDRRCLRRALRLLDGNLASILSRLRSAAGSQARIAGVVYYDPFLGRVRRGGSLAIRALDRRLVRAYRRAGVVAVRLDRAISGRKRLCRMTGACRRRFDLRPTPRGERAIAAAFLAAIGNLPRPAGARAGQTGQFVTPCRYSHRAPDDPIVYPNQPGASHSHDFFGNTSTSASSTLDTLNAAATNCRRVADRSAYWVPTLLLNGQAVTPRGATIYYRDAGKDPGGVRPFPSGLRVIAGSSKATAPQSLDIISWGCGSESGIERQQAPPVCPSGRMLQATVRFPDCWNGRDLDSVDHKSHLAYSLPRRGGGRVCDPGHPIEVPKIALHVNYPIAGGSGVTLSSGASYTEHADFFNAWDPPTLDQLVLRCLVADVKCQGTSS